MALDIDTKDKINDSVRMLGFLSDMLRAWDVDSVPLEHDHTYSMSICIDDAIQILKTETSATTTTTPLKP